MCIHVQQMKSYIDRLENVDDVFIMNLDVNLVLALPCSYDNFIMTYHLNSKDKILMELKKLL